MTATVGSTVHILPEDSRTHAGTYTVVKVNPTTYRLQRQGDGAFLRASHDFVRPGELPRFIVTSTPESTMVTRSEEHFDNGAVVTVYMRGVNPDALWVVTGETPKGYRIFPLGGSARYYTGVPSRLLTRVTTITEWTA